MQALHTSEAGEDVAVICVRKLRLRPYSESLGFAKIDLSRIVDRTKVRQSKRQLLLLRRLKCLHSDIETLRFATRATFVHFRINELIPVMNSIVLCLRTLARCSVLQRAAVCSSSTRTIYPLQ